MIIFLKKWLPLSLIILTLILFYAFDLDRFFSFEVLQTYHQILTEKVAQNFILSLLIYSTLYIIVAAASIPIAAFMTILGGFLFGPYITLIIADISATLGGSLLFLSVKTSLGEVLEQKASHWVKKMETGFQKNAFAYLVFLRLVPIFPFWATNIVAALANIPFRTFFLATLIGIIPVTFAYALIGNGLDVLLSQNQSPDLSLLFKHEIFLPLFILALLSILPIFYNRWKNRK